MAQQTFYKTKTNVFATTRNTLNLSVIYLDNFSRFEAKLSIYILTAVTRVNQDHLGNSVFSGQNKAILTRPRTRTNVCKVYQGSARFSKVLQGSAIYILSNTTQFDTLTILQGNLTKRTGVCSIGHCFVVKNLDFMALMIIAEQRGR